MQQRLPSASTVLSTADFFTAGALMIGVTYGLCASTYLVPFIASNVVHVGVACLLSYAKSKNYITEDQFSAIYTLFACSTICLAFYGFGENIGKSLGESYNYLSNTMMPYAAPFSGQISTAILDKLSYLVHKDSLVGTAILGGIAPLCLGLINKISSFAASKPTEQTSVSKDAKLSQSNEREQNINNSSILGATIKELIAQYPKYILHKSIFAGNLLVAPLAGAITYTIQFLFDPNKPKTTVSYYGLGITRAMIGAYNYTAYELLDKTIGLPTMIAAAAGIEMSDGAFKSTANSFAQRLDLEASKGSHLKIE